METVYRLFMYLFPFAFSLALYVWMFRKASLVPKKIYRGVALAIIVAGIGYTLYRIVATIGNVFTDDRFHFGVMIVTIVVLAVASIIMTVGEPEK